MADNTTSRSYRSGDAPRRQPSDGQDAALGTDPLAELARLIGQNDPFAEAAPRNPQVNDQQATRRELAPADDWRLQMERPPYETMRDEQPADTHYPAADSHHPSLVPQDGYRDVPLLGAASGYADDPRYQAIDPSYGNATRIHGETIPFGEDGYDDPPYRKQRAARSGGAVASAALMICCAMLGTAGAYGYRVYSKPSSGVQQAPVIVADSSPSKIVPQAAEQKNARTQERFGSQEGGERLVSREEQPVAVPSASNPFDRVVSPALASDATGTTQPSIAASPAPATPSAQSSSGAATPKRVRTVAIRPNPGDTSGRPIVAEPPTPGRAPATRSVATVPTSPAARADASPAPARGGPLSLDPTAQAQASVPARPQQHALTPPAARESASKAPRLASASPSTSGQGHYLVQVSSQRSESDAQASYRGLQAKYSQLRSRQAQIRRADLGSKGTFYRAMVGPFASSAEADQFCGGLKRAGGQCVILRN